MSFDSLLNQKCDFDKNTPSEDPDSGQEIESWAAVASDIPCRLDPRSGGLVDNPQYEYEKATHILFTRSVAGVNHKEIKYYRVDIEGIKYRLLLIKDLAETTVRHHWEIFLELLG